MSQLEIAEQFQGRTNNNTTFGGKQANNSNDIEVANVEEVVLDMGDTTHHMDLTTEVIRETQFHPNNRNIYNDILASIGLDSPTNSQDVRRGIGNKDYDHFGQVVSTPIRNSASSLIALGKHVLTPKQGRIWETHRKSPLGG